MTEIFAHPGEVVTDRSGNVICHVKIPLIKNALTKASDFHEFADGETPWQMHDPVDTRCVRPSDKTYGLQICIEGEWRP